VEEWPVANIFVYGWMDSAGVFFIDPITGPGRQAIIVRKNPLGLPVQFTVPLMIVLYNKYMHAVDVFDQVRKNFGCDLSNATKKCTVRVFEILFSMCLAQAYNIHRTVHANNPNRLMSHTQFKCSVVSGLMNHPIVKPPAVAAVDEHVLLQHAPGSLGATLPNGDPSMRRKTFYCHSCPALTADGTAKNYARTTSYYCGKCLHSYHPECFNLHFAHTNSPAPKRVRNNAPVIAAAPVVAAAPAAAAAADFDE